MWNCYFDLFYGVWSSAKHTIYNIFRYYGLTRSAINCCDGDWSSRIIQFRICQGELNRPKSLEIRVVDTDIGFCYCGYCIRSGNLTKMIILIQNSISLLSD